MPLNRTALLLGCFVSTAALISAGRAAELPKRPLALASAADANVPFVLQAPAAGPAAPQARTRSPLLSDTQPQAVARLTQPRAVPEPEAGPAKIDESALRFYASQNDAARVSMEIKRIKAQNPSWEPPSNLFDEGADPASEQKLWDLFGAGRFDEIRAAVEEMRAADPTWRPSDDFVKKFERAEARAQLIAASDAKDPAGVLSVAGANPDMLVCADVDAMWRVAEALVQTGEIDRAQDLYRHVLTHCPNPAERLATLQKAKELLPSPAVKALVGLMQRRTDGAAEIEAFRLDLLRGQIGALIADASAEPVPPADLRAFEALVAQKKLASDAVMLGWLRYSQKDWTGAAQWFKQAMTWERAPKAAEGYILTLRQQGQAKEAQAAAYEWRDADPLIAKLYIDIAAMALTEPKPAAMEPDQLARTEEVVEKAASANGAQALGWYYYNTGGFPKAGAWFAKSVAWSANETNVLGLALSAHRVKDRGLFQKTIAEYGGRYPAVAALAAYDRAEGPRVRSAARRGGGGGQGGQGGQGSQAGRMAQEAVALFKDGRYNEALATLDKRAQVAREDQGLGVLRGWTLYHLSQYDKAKAQFAEMDKRQSNRDTQYGLYYSGSKLAPLHLGE